MVYSDRVKNMEDIKKEGNMKMFQLDEKYYAVCETKNTRSGFKHTANLLKNGYSVYKTKINYYNRTWEYFTYEDVLRKLINGYFEKKEAETYIDKIEKEYNK